MYIQTLVHIPEVVTGLIGAAFILASFWSSVRYNRRVANGDLREEDEDVTPVTAAAPQHVSQD